MWQHPDYGEQQSRGGGEARPTKGVWRRNIQTQQFKNFNRTTSVPKKDFRPWCSDCVLSCFVPFFFLFFLAGCLRNFQDRQAAFSVSIWIHHTVVKQMMYRMCAWHPKCRRLGSTNAFALTARWIGSLSVTMWIAKGTMSQCPPPDPPPPPLNRCRQRECFSLRSFSEWLDVHLFLIWICLIVMRDWHVMPMAFKIHVPPVDYSHRQNKSEN